MKKKILKISALFVAVLLIAGVCWFANSLIGNPISKALAKNTAEKYLAETYGDTDYELTDVSYSFKDGYYYAHISSKSSIDTNFSLLINGFGKLRFDYYENNVTSGWNTATRLDTEYRNAVDIIIDSKNFPYSKSIAFGKLVFVASEDKGMRDVPDYALITNELTLDAYYNVNELGARSGKLTLYIYDTNVSAERMSEILLGIRRCFDDSGLGFYAIDCVLEHPRDENGFSEDGQIEVMDFLYSDIHEDGLVERVIEADKAAKDHYYTLDSEKLDEIN